MRFKYSEGLVIDTDTEPWSREGLRVGIFGGPGSTKSYTATATFIEQFLQAGGTVVIFQPRAEYHTLKEKFPDLQVAGGPYNQDIPFTASQPKLYADAVVEQGVSLVFYTKGIDEEKLISFVERFLDYVMASQEVRHRPLMMVLEEAHEYAPMNPKGHTAPPWVFNRMVRVCRDLWTSGRKLNIVPIAITQRPQGLNFDIRQLSNLSLYGSFNPQDMKYIDKECLAEYRKQGLEIDSDRLLTLKPGEFLVIHHKDASYEQRTVQRKTQHGADTPSLSHVPEASAKVRTMISDLGQKLKEMMEKEEQEESELAKSKRKISELEKAVEEWKGKAKLGADLRELLKGGDVDVEEIEKKVKAQYEEELSQAKAKADAWQRAATDEHNAVNQLDEQVMSLEKKLEVYSKLKDALRDFVAVESVDENRIVERVLAKIPVQPAEGHLVVDQTQADLEVRVHREKVTAQESTLRGQIAILIAEGALGDKSVTGRTIARKLNAMGYKAEGIYDELDWFVKQRIIEHEIEQDGTHKYRVRDKSRVIMKVVA